MKGALLTKAVLCACPPALAVGAVATVPPVRKAVHHITSSKKPVTRTRARQPRQLSQAVAARPCPPLPVLATPEIPLLAVPEELLPASALSPLGVGSPSAVNGGPGPAIGTPVFFPGIPGGGGVVGGVPTPPGGGGVVTPPPATTVPPPVTPPAITPVPAVPEPATWAMMLIGFGLVGGLLRRRSSPLPLGSGGVPKPFPMRISKRLKWVAAAGEGGVLMADSGSTFALAASPATSAAVAKALLCVCPVALMTVAATTVPPVRDAVHRATAPAVPSGATLPVSAVPCDPVAAAQRNLIQVSVPDVPATPGATVTLSDPASGTGSSPAPQAPTDA